MKGAIISVNPHIVEVERFEKPEPRSFGEAAMWPEVYTMQNWQDLNSANWQLPVHEESLKAEECPKCQGEGIAIVEYPVDCFHTDCPECEGDGFLYPYINQPVTIKEIKNGKAILL